MIHLRIGTSEYSPIYRPSTKKNTIPKQASVYRLSCLMYRLVYWTDWYPHISRHWLCCIIHSSPSATCPSSTTQIELPANCLRRWQWITRTRMTIGSDFGDSVQRDLEFAKRTSGLGVRIKRDTVTSFSCAAIKPPPTTLDTHTPIIPAPFNIVAVVIADQYFTITVGLIIVHTQQSWWKYPSRRWSHAWPSRRSVQMPLPATLLLPIILHRFRRLIHEPKAPLPSSHVDNNIRICIFHHRHRQLNLKSLPLLNVYQIVPSN